MVTIMSFTLKFVDRYEKVSDFKVDPRTGMVMNLADLKQFMRAILEQIDHKVLHDLEKARRQGRSLLPAPHQHR